MTDRWVCKRCFADNNETDSACQRCGLIRGAEATPTDQTAWASQAGAATTAPDPGWRRWIRFWWIPALAIALVVGYLTTARRGDDGSLASAGNVSVEELREGDCFNTDEEEISDVDGVPCTQAHEYEVFALSDYEGDGTYPGSDAEFDAIFQEICIPDFEPYVGLPYADSEIFGYMITPSEETWSDGDRAYICVLYDPDDTQLTESLAGANR